MKSLIERAAFYALTVSICAIVFGYVHAQQPSLTSRSLFRIHAISNNLGVIQASRLTYSLRPKVISVALLPGRMGIGGVTVRPLDRLRLQVWILRPNGTTMPQRSASSPRPESAGFLFDDMPDDEIEGVVVSVDGTLYVHKA